MMQNSRNITSLIPKVLRFSAAFYLAVKYFPLLVRPEEAIRQIKILGIFPSEYLLGAAFIISGCGALSAILIASGKGRGGAELLGAIILAFSGSTMLYSYFAGILNSCGCAKTAIPFTTVAAFSLLDFICTAALLLLLAGVLREKD